MEAKATPGVTAATPLIDQPLMATYEGRVEGVLVRGMGMEDILDNPALNGKVVAGAGEIRDSRQRRAGAERDEEPKRDA